MRATQQLTLTLAQLSMGEQKQPIAVKVQKARNRVLCTAAVWKESRFSITPKGSTPRGVSGAGQDRDSGQQRSQLCWEPSSRDSPLKQLTTSHFQGQAQRSLPKGLCPPFC